MHEAVMQEIANAGIFIGAAAVADYRPEKIAAEKIKKVSDDMKTHKNPQLRSGPQPFKASHSGPTPYKAPAAAAQKPAAAPKPAKCELQGKKWIVVR